MLDEPIRLAMKHFFYTGYFVKTNSSYELIEKSEEGKTYLKLIVGIEDNICVMCYDDKKRCEFFNSNYGLRKCIDHFILLKCKDCWELHMIEMKTTVDRDEWEKIKQKFRASYWNIRILTQFLGISFDIERVFLYTTYENEDLGMEKSSNPRVNVLRVGGYIPDASKEWNGEILTSIRIVPYDDRDEAIFKFRHTKIQMKRSDDGERLEGTYTLSERNSL